MKYIALAALAAAISSILMFAVMLKSGFVTDSREMQVSANITDRPEGKSIGISLDQDRLDFGLFPKGSISRRSVVVENSANMASRFRFNVTGGISPFLAIPQGPVYLGPFEKKEIVLALNATAAGNFTGKLSVESLTPINKYFETVLLWI